MKLEWYHIAIIVLSIFLIWYVYNDNSVQECNCDNVDNAGKTTANARVNEGFREEDKPCATLYYTSWCGFSQKFLPEWEKFEKRINSDPKMKSKLKLKKIQCDGGNENMCNEQGITGYPTVIINFPDDTKVPIPGYRSADDLLKKCQEYV